MRDKLIRIIRFLYAAATYTLLALAFTFFVPATVVFVCFFAWFIFGVFMAQPVFLVLFIVTLITLLVWVPLTEDSGDRVRKGRQLQRRDPKKSSPKPRSSRPSTTNGPMRPKGWS